MRKTLLLSLPMLILVSALAARNVDIVPYPTGMTGGVDGVFEMSAATPIVVAKGSEDLAKTAGIYAALSEKIFGRKTEVRQGRPAKGAINASIDKSLGEEEYVLEIAPQRIDISGGSAKAVMYAFQTLTQVAVGAGVNDGTAALPSLRIQDKPQFEYRGAMLDVCRHFYSVDDVKTFIDILALHKMNKFHFHLTDDQGWRIEIKKYPELTRVGSIRKESHIGHYGEQRWDTQPYGGFFTQEQIKDIVRYAADRHIDVIPEIEMPGHATAALASYPWLGCIQEGYQTGKTWGVLKEVFCAGREGTFEFLEGVLEEVIPLFPYKYIHIGGDECPKDRWKECPHCQQRIKDNNLKNEEELQSYFVHRMEKWLNEHGKSIVGWDEILEGGELSKTATVMSWRGTKGGIEAAKKGNRVIMAPNSNCYLDYYQGPRESEPLAIFGNTPVAKTYELDPYAGLDESQRGFIWGVQGNLWTEYIGNMAYAQYMLLPRLAAIAETGWSYPYKDYGDFVRRMQTMRKLYDAYGYNYAKHIFDGE